MIVPQSLSAIIIILLPGLLIVRLLKKDFDTLLYSVGLGLLFLVVVGIISNFTFGMRTLPVILVYLLMLVILGIVSWKFGKRLSIKWQGWTPLIIPITVFGVALALQYQTTLMSANLVGSDIHLEYYQANKVLENGYWNPLEQGSTMNAVLGITMLLPVIKLMTGMTLLSVFNVVCPLIFAVLPLALYRIYKNQFGVTIAVLSVLFFVTMPMFTMDMTQLVRQQQSELFFVLAVLALLDNNLGIKRMVLLSVLFGIGAVVTHYGLSLGFIGYYLFGAIIIVAIAKFWRRGQKVEWRKVFAKASAMILVIVIMAVGYLGFYGWVDKGEVLPIASIPFGIAGATIQQWVSGVSQGELPAQEDPPESIKSDDMPSFEQTPLEKIFNRFPYLNPLVREPLLQTAIGLDFGRASIYGKIWRILQYLVELCLIVGLFALLFSRKREASLEYVSLVVASAFVVAGLYLLTTYSYGMGATRIWQITLLFMSPLFVIGVGKLGSLFTGLKLNSSKVVACSVLVLLVPYAMFNQGVVFELAKMTPSGFVDVPYSVALSGWRVDIATVFEKEDIEALDWLEAYIKETGDDKLLWGDTHVARLMAQRFGWSMPRGVSNELYIAGNIRSLEYLYLYDKNDSGYIFLSKRNVETNMITYQAEYASRKSYNINDLPLLKEKLAKGKVLFDNGARIVEVQ